VFAARSGDKFVSLIDLPQSINIHPTQPWQDQVHDLYDIAGLMRIEFLPWPSSVTEEDGCVKAPRARPTTTAPPSSSVYGRNLRLIPEGFSIDINDIVHETNTCPQTPNEHHICQRPTDHTSVEAHSPVTYIDPITDTESIQQEWLPTALCFVTPLMASSNSSPPYF